MFKRFSEIELPAAPTFWAFMLGGAFLVGLIGEAREDHEPTEYRTGTQVITTTTYDLFSATGPIE